MCRAIRQDIYQFFKSLFLYLSSGDRGQGLKSSTLLEARISNEHAGTKLFPGENSATERFARSRSV